MKLLLLIFYSFCTIFRKESIVNIHDQYTYKSWHFEISTLKCEYYKVRACVSVSYIIQAILPSSIQIAIRHKKDIRPTLTIFNKTERLRIIFCRHCTYVHIHIIVLSCVVKWVRREKWVSFESKLIHTLRRI